VLDAVGIDWRRRPSAPPRNLAGAFLVTRIATVGGTVRAARDGITDCLTGPLMFLGSRETWLSAAPATSKDPDLDDLSLTPVVIAHEMTESPDTG
jgi:hypothetical protein